MSGCRRPGHGLRLSYSSTTSAPGKACMHAGRSGEATRRRRVGGHAIASRSTTASSSGSAAGRVGARGAGAAVDDQAQRDRAAEVGGQRLLDLGRHSLAALAVDGVGQGEDGGAVVDADEAARTEQALGAGAQPAEDAVAPRQGQLVAARQALGGRRSAGGRRRRGWAVAAAPASAAARRAAAARGGPWRRRRAAPAPPAGGAGAARRRRRRARVGDGAPALRRRGAGGLGRRRRPRPARQRPLEPLDALEQGGRRRCRARAGAAAPARPRARPGGRAPPACRRAPRPAPPGPGRWPAGPRRRAWSATRSSVVVGQADERRRAIAARNASRRCASRSLGQLAGVAARRRMPSATATRARPVSRSHSASTTSSTDAAVVARSPPAAADLVERRQRVAGRAVAPADRQVDGLVGARRGRRRRRPTAGARRARRPAAGGTRSAGCGCGWWAAPSAGRWWPARTRRGRAAPRASSAARSTPPSRACGPRRGCTPSSARACRARPATRGRAWRRRRCSRRRRARCTSSDVPAATATHDSHDAARLAVDRVPRS